MVTIFDGMERMTEEELRYEIALLEQITVSGFARLAAKKAQQTTIRFANKVTSLLGTKSLQETAVFGMAQQVAMAQEALGGKNGEELRHILKGNLCRKLEELGVAGADQMSGEELSVQVTAKAAEALEGVHAYLTPLRKAEAVADKNRRKEPEDFENTVLKNKLSRELLAHTVMSCVRAYGEKFSPPFVQMPGYLSGQERENYETEEKNAHDAVLQNREFHREYQSLENALELCKNQAATKQSAYQALAEKEDYLMTKEVSGEDAESVRAMLEETRRDMEECLNKKREYEEEYYAKQVELELLQQKNDSADSAMSKLADVRKREFEAAWAQAFPKLSFKEGVIASVARNFRYTERLDLEEAFTELNGAQHPGSLDETPGEHALYNVCRFYMEDTGFAGRIAYHVKEGRILILQVQKSR